VTVLRRLFALDHNFPQPVLAALSDVLQPVAELVPIHQIDPGFAELSDWELIRELHRHPRSWDGMITNDDTMLSLPKEMTVLSQTGLTLVVAKGEGHNPVRAIGTLLCHLNHICHHTDRRTAQIWKLRVAQKRPELAHDYLEKIALQANRPVEKIIAENKLPARDLRTS
jgi:hypothetical protein